MSFSDVVIGPPLVVGFALRPTGDATPADRHRQPTQNNRQSRFAASYAAGTDQERLDGPRRGVQNIGDLILEKAAPVPQHERLASPLSGASIRSSGLSLGCSVMADHGGRPGRFSRRTLLSAAGAALVSADLAATARAGVLVDQRFDRMRDRNGWGRGWYARHFSLLFDVHDGRGRLHLPTGLKSSAPSQPIPVFLLDHECRDGTHELHFHVTHGGFGRA